MSEKKIMISKYYTVLIVWEIAAALFSGLFLSRYAGAVIGFGVMAVSAVLLYFPFKKLREKKNKGLTLYHLLFGTAGAAGAAMMISEAVAGRTDTDFEIWQVLLAVSVFLFLLPVFSFLHLDCESLTGKITNKEKSGAVDAKKPDSSGTDEKNSTKWFYLLPVPVSFCIVFLLQPFDIFLHNRTDIPFSFGDTFISMFYFVPVFLITVYFVSLFPKKVTEYIGALTSAVNVAAYIQLMFFNRYTGELAGGEYNWKEHPGFTYINLFVWIAVVCVFIVLGVRKKTKKIGIWLNLVILTLLTVAFVSSVITAPKESFGRDNSFYYYLDGTEQFTVGSDENIVLLIADAVDNAFVKEIMEEDPDFFDDYRDFTLYTNTCSVYDYTSYSMAQMLYGYTQKEGTEKTGQFMGRLCDAGYRNLFFERVSLYAPGNPEKYIANYAYSKDLDRLLTTDQKLVRINYLKIVGYQLFPCILKKLSNVKNVDFNKCILYKQMEMDCVNVDSEFDRALNLSLNENSGKCFVYQHLEGPHPPCEDYVGESRYCLEIFKKYLNQMKELGVYDNSVIIIAADHGVHDGVDDIPYPTPATPMFMVKRKQETHDHIVLSGKPLYYRDFQATVLKYAGLYREEDLKLFGKTIDDYSENELRTRVWFDGNFENDEIRKYTYRGDTKELERVVYEGEYETVKDKSFDFSELEPE